MSDKPDCFEDERWLQKIAAKPWVLRSDAEKEILRTGQFPWERERPIVWPVGMISADWDKR